MSDPRAPTPRDERPASRRWGLGRILLIAWAVVLLAGTAGEVLGIEALRDLTDLKRIFLF